MTRLTPTLLCLTLCLGLQACAPTPVGQTNPDPNAAQLSSDIRPGTKGQRLELVEGELLVPAGTSAYAIMSNPSMVSQPTRFAADRMAARRDSAQPAQNPLWHLLSPPALAEDSFDESVVTDSDDAEADTPIDKAQIEQLSASVDGQPVALEILLVAAQSDGSLLVSYRLKDVPASDLNVVVAFTSPSGALKIKGVLPRLAAGMRKLSQRFDVETTALAEALEQTGETDRDLSSEELQRLAKSEVVQQIRDKVYEHLVKAEKGKRFDDVVPGLVRGLLPGSSLKSYIEQRRQCKRRRCAQQPALPPQAERPVAQAILQLVTERQRLRAELLAQTRVPTAEERAQLLRLGPLARRAACRERKLYPCPGIN